MFSYDDSVIRQERLLRGADHCASTGKVHVLADLVRGGRVVDPRDARRPLTTGGTSPMTASVLIYAVDANFNIHVAFDGVRGTPNAVKHETLFHNADVRAAGELTVRDGMIMRVSDQSGSYRTSGHMEIHIVSFEHGALTSRPLPSAPFPSPTLNVSSKMAVNKRAA